MLLLCSNNYLGLADHPRGRARPRPRRRCAGAPAPGASRLISGNMAPHRRLEERLADFKGYEAALLFGSGYLANTGDDRGAGRRAARSSSPTSSTTPASSTAAGSPRAETFVYRHGDVEHLAWGLREAGERGGADRHRRRLLDGRRRRAARASWPSSPARHGCRLMVDEAHATGALGPGGRGSVAAAGLSDEVDVVVGTLGKALGSYGAYVCASAELREYLLNTARPFIFSTAPPPPVVAAAAAALELLEVAAASGSSGCGRTPRRCATALAAEGLAAGGSRTQIVPVEVGDAEPTMELCERLLERGVFAQAIRPPTVPEGSSRLRFTVMATHRGGELRARREAGRRGRARAGDRHRRQHRARRVAVAA